MKKVIILAILFVVVIAMVGCAKIPVYKVEGDYDGNNVCIFYVTVSGEYDEAGLKKVCKQLDLVNDKPNVVYFFEPNAPRNDKDTGYYDAGMPDSDYSIASYKIEDGEFED